MSFGDRLQAVRRGAGMTQEAFAQQLKVSRQAVSKWESSRGYPEIEKIIYICNHYGVSMDELFLDEVPRRSSVQTEPGKPDDQPMANPPLKQSLANFFSNLSPRNRLLVWAGPAVVVLALILLLSASLMKGASNEMVPMLVWLGLLILFAVGEAVSVGLTSIWFAAGSLAALICALLNGPLWLQITLFIVVSVLCLLAVRPLAKKYLNGKVQPTNVDRIIGEEAQVTEEIDNIQGKGAVTIGGVTWSARSQSGEPIPAGQLVRVLRIEGVKVFVAPAKDAAPV